MTDEMNTHPNDEEQTEYIGQLAPETPEIIHDALLHAEENAVTKLSEIQIQIARQEFLNAWAERDGDDE